MYHCEANTGYAIGKLEPVLWQMAINLAEGDISRVHLAYPSYRNGMPGYVPPGFTNFLTFDPGTDDKAKLRALGDYLQSNKINVLFGFDQPPRRPYYRYARAANVQKIVSYWGAPMSSINRGLKLILKRWEVALLRHGPDFYIFESEAMRRTAIEGRGIGQKNTTLCHTGVDTETYKPLAEDRFYAHDLWKIPRNKKLIFYSGHFEPRKGIAVIIEAANALCRERNDVAFVLCGNKAGEELPYVELLSEAAKPNTIFGGYRDDLNRLHRGCYAGVIASTGWDSFPMSSLEMQSSGLPVLVSDLQGSKETIAPGQSGILFSPGDSRGLADLINRLCDSPAEQQEMGLQARSHIEKNLSKEAQVAALTRLVTS